MAAIPYRLFSFSVNDLPHGDIHLDIAAARGLQEQGALLIPLITYHSNLEGQNETAYYLDQHAPLWPILGAIVSNTGDIYLSFKLLSLFSGILLIPLSFLTVRRVMDEPSAWLAALFITLSYILNDFSGNGSLYILQALFFILIILTIQTENAFSSFLTGLLVSLVYLLNYQAVVAFFAVGCVFLVSIRQASDRRTIIKHLLIYLVTFFVTLLPWLIRNTLIFGSPFYSANIDYLLENLGLPYDIQFVDERLLRVWSWQDLTWQQVLTSVAGWSFRNTGYFLLRILVLAPLVTIFIPFGLSRWRQVTHTSPNRDASIVYGLLLVFHLTISIAWPSFKFRYFVPLLPLWLGIGAYGLVSLFKGNRWLYPIVVGSLACFLAVNWVTYQSVPSHTNYYDSNEFYHYRIGEAEWQGAERNLQEIAQQLLDKPSGIIIAPLEAVTYTGRTVLTTNNLHHPEIVLHYIHKHKIQWIIDKPFRLEFYQGFLDIQLIQQNDSFIILAIGPTPTYPP